MNARKTDTTVVNGSNEEKKATKITDHPMGMIQETRTHQTQAQEQWLDTSRRLRNMTQ